MEKNNKKKIAGKELALSIARGPEFALAGTGKAGLMQADRKAFKRKQQRKEGKAAAKKAMRGDY